MHEDVQPTDEVERRLLARIETVAAARLEEDAARVRNDRRLFQRQENVAIGNASDAVDPLRVAHTEEAEMLERCVWVASQATVVILPTGDEAARGKRALAVPWRNFQQLFAQSLRARMRGAREVLIPITKLWLESEARITVAHLGMSIGRPRMYVGEDGWNTVNLWTPRPRRAAQSNDEGHVRAFLDHVAYLLPIDEERGRFLDWLAHCEQQPEVLPHHGWLFWTESFGIGRNWLASVLTRVWRGEVAASLDLAALIDSGFNGRLAAKRMAIVDEIHLNDSGRAMFATEARLRQMMTAETRRINHKYGAEYDEANCVRWLIFSNHADALPMPREDRRFAVAENPSEPRAPEYYAALYARLMDAEFADAIGAWLASRDVSAFNPGAKPPVNDAKRRVIEATTPQLDRDLAQLIEDWPWPVAAGSDLLLALGIDRSDTTKAAHFGIAMKRARHVLLKSRPKLARGDRPGLWLLAGRTTPDDPAATVDTYRQSADFAAMRSRSHRF